VGDGRGDRPVRPRSAYAAAGAGGAVTLGAAGRGIFGADDPSAPAIFCAAAGAVVVVLGLVAGRLGLRPSLRAFAAAPVLGLLLAGAAHLVIILSLSLVFPPAQDLVDVVIGTRVPEDIDARLLVVLLVTAAVLAPLTEEPAKAVGATFARAETLRGAFLAGVTAGAGFSIVEHAFYALPAAEYGDDWVQVLLLRSVSGAMHPLASGLVYLGWWEFRRTNARRALVRGPALGAGLHAAWNSTAVVVEGVSDAVTEGNLPRPLATLGLVYVGVVGIAIALFLWRTIKMVAGAPGLPPAEAPVVEWPPDRRAGIILGIALFVPLALLVVILPRLGPT
jgi:RsiW-degrading membrane proteinase PrsW (M82 family)